MKHDFYSKKQLDIEVDDTVEYDKDWWYLEGVKDAIAGKDPWHKWDNSTDPNLIHCREAYKMGYADGKGEEND